jgi:hypothetical protein
VQKYSQLAKYLDHGSAATVQRVCKADTVKTAVPEASVPKPGE